MRDENGIKFVLVESLLKLTQAVLGAHA
jgi:hypothetical protein